MLRSRTFRGSLSAASLLFLSCTFTGDTFAQVVPRILHAPNNSRAVRLERTVHPAVAAAIDLGPAEATLPMERMILQLKASPEQEAALEQLILEQQDPQSSHYREWLTPEQFGDQFGIAQQDLDAVTAWLSDQGFRVDHIASGRRTIEFSGNASQVERAFHTQIRHYQWNGARHLANSTDLSIPEALSPVVAGVVSVNDFFARPQHHVLRSIGPAPAPLTNFNGGIHGVSPYDFAAIYDVNPLWNNGYDGTGQSVAVVGRTNIMISDISGFRSLFGLPVNNPQIIVNGTNPGDLGGGEETEADLDVEWAGSVAKGAAIKFVVSASTNNSDGAALSALYIVNNNVAPVMTMSFGLCEAQMGAGNQFYSNLWQQAATEGISVFVASGDSGSAGCDIPSSTSPASLGFGVSGLSSTPYNVSVGGTQFQDTPTSWSASNGAHLASATGYIPEMAWNESSYTTAGAASNNLYSGGGGVSTIYARPSWQAGTGNRMVPDVSLTAAGHDGYVIEQEGNLYLVGGTSASTPAFAGLMAIVDQYTATRNGNPNSKLYGIALHAPSAFHEITAGTNEVPCAGGSPNCSSTTAGTVGHLNGYSAAVGYDMATGLGSVDAYLLAANWGAVTAAPAISSLSPNPMTGSTSAQALTIKGAGFATGLTVKVGSTSYTTFTSFSSTQIVLNVTVGTTTQTLGVQVVNPGNSASNTVNLQVNAPVTPSISSLSPNPMTGSTAAQPLTINGSGFVSGLTVKVGSISYTSFSSFASTKIVLNVTVGTTAQTLGVQVVNPGNLASNTVNLQVTAPPAGPSITSLSPNPITGSASAQPLTISGSGFASGLTVKVGTATYTSLTSLTASQIVLNVVVGTTAQTLGVQVINPGNKASNTVNLQVTAPAPPPAITSLSPNPMTGSTSPQFLTVNGSGFQSGLKLVIGSTTITSSQLSSITATQLKVSLIVGTTTHTYTVTVINPDGKVSNTVNFQVNAPTSSR